MDIFPTKIMIIIGISWDTHLTIYSGVSEIGGFTRDELGGFWATQFSPSGHG